jgi:protein disulfide-isomerase A1
MDATENDIPLSAPFRISLSAPFRVGGFPTIKFKPAGRRDFIDYEGDRSLEALIKFVESKAKNSLVAAASAGTESTGTESASAASVTPETVVPAAGGMQWLRVWLLAQM